MITRNFWPKLNAIKQIKDRCFLVSGSGVNFHQHRSPEYWFKNGSSSLSLGFGCRQRVKSFLLHKSLERWVLLSIWISFHLLTTAVKQMLLINYIQTKNSLEFYCSMGFVFFHHRRKKKEEDWMWCNVVTHCCHSWRWGGRWWCPSAAPSSSPQKSGGRLGTPAGPSV